MSAILPTLTPNLAAAERLLTALDDSAEFYTFQTFDDHPARKDRTLARILHGSLNQHHIDLQRLQARGAGVYVTVNATDGQGRKLANMVRPRALWCEWDHRYRPLPEWPLDPHLVVETSQGKYHLYWMAADLSWADFDTLMASLVALGSDPNAKDRARVLRLPGFWHQKTTTPFQVRIVKDNPCLPYTREDLLAAFSNLAAPLPAPTPTPELTPSPHPDPHWQALVTRLVAEHTARTWADPKVGRNAQVMSLGHELASHGVPERFDEMALGQFEATMRQTNTAGELAPLNWANEWVALKHGRTTATAGPTVVHGERIANALIAQAVREAKANVKPAATPVMPPLPPVLLDPPGALGVFVRWCGATARFPQPVLALANGLALFGALIGQTARTPTDLRSNLYVLGIAPSATGKDHSRQCVKKLLKVAGLTARLGGENLASDSGLLGAVYRQPACLFQIDEFGRVLKTLSQPEKAHLYAIPTALMQLYSAANSLFLGKEYAHGDRKDIDQPCACLYGTTVPAHFFAALTHDQAQDGFLARFLIFQGSDDPPEQDTRPTPPPDDLVAFVQALAGRPRNPHPQGNLDAVLGIDPPILPYEPDAKAALDALLREMTAGRKQQQREGTDALWGRCGESAIKVALIAAIADGSKTITLRHAQFGITVARWCVGTMAACVRLHVAENETENAGKRVERLIREAGAGGLRAGELHVKTRFLKKRERADIIDDLIESGLIFRLMENAQGAGDRPVTRLIHAEFADVKG
ncbi:MAG: DUF3987 domain-containing protein [Candidatus Competibacter denitrificans]